MGSILGYPNFGKLLHHNLTALLVHANLVHAAIFHLCLLWTAADLRVLGAVPLHWLDVQGMFFVMIRASRLCHSGADAVHLSIRAEDRTDFGVPNAD